MLLPPPQPPTQPNPEVVSAFVSLKAVACIKLSAHPKWAGAVPLGGRRLL